MQDNITISLIELFERFPNAESARLYIEKNRWNGKPACPFCGCDHQITARHGKREGVYRCRSCGEEFTVRTGTIFERSHVPLHKWLVAIYLTVTDRKGISSLALSKKISVTQKTAWFMQVRIREACGNGSDGGMLTGIVEADETYIGGKRKNMSNAKRKALAEAGAGRGADGKVAVLGMRERGGKLVAMPIDDTKGKTIKGAIKQHVAKGSAVYTDEAKAYKGMDGYIHGHVNHSAREYVGANDIHTNGIESVWSQLKRGLYGVWHHASKKHIHRYVNEATFRLNEGNVEVHTIDRINALLTKAVGKRITYDEATA